MSAAGIFKGELWFLAACQAFMSPTLERVHPNGVPTPRQPCCFSSLFLSLMHFFRTSYIMQKPHHDPAFDLDGEAVLRSRSSDSTIMAAATSNPALSACHSGTVKMAACSRMNEKERHPLL